jgi:hypothetical protein
MKREQQIASHSKHKQVGQPHSPTQVKNISDQTFSRKHLPLQCHSLRTFLPLHLWLRKPLADLYGCVINFADECILAAAPIKDY